MRTANEMYQFCLDNGYGQGFNTRNSIKHFGIIEKNLGNDENVLFAFIGLHNYVSISKHDNNFAYAVTNKRRAMGIARGLISFPHPTFSSTPMGKSCGI